MAATSTIVIPQLTGAGNPNTLGIPGNLNDEYRNTLATGNNDWIWRCSVASPTAATWVGKL